MWRDQAKENSYNFQRSSQTDNFEIIMMKLIYLYFFSIYSVFLLYWFQFESCGHTRVLPLKGLSGSSYRDLNPVPLRELYKYFLFTFHHPHYHCFKAGFFRLAWVKWNLLKQIFLWPNSLLAISLHLFQRR